MSAAAPENPLNPDMAALVKGVAISASIKHAPHHNKHASIASARTSLHNELRVAQAYLYEMNYFGDPQSIRAGSVMHGRYDGRTQTALTQFVARSGMKYDLHSAKPSTELFNAIRRESGDYLAQRKLEHAGDTNQASMAVERELLAEAFDMQPHADDWNALRRLHPQMRFPAAAALHALRTQYGMDIGLRETSREEETQEKLIMTGRSMSPPGYSFHSSGLAIDIFPRDRKGRAATSNNDPHWPLIHEVMERYGFYAIALHNHGWDHYHHEIPAKLQEMVLWPTGQDGWKEIPANRIPLRWSLINERALSERIVETPPSLPLLPLMASTPPSLPLPTLPVVTVIEPPPVTPPVTNATKPHKQQR